MKRLRSFHGCLLVLSFCTYQCVSVQQSFARFADTRRPQVLRYSGSLRDDAGKSRTGTVRVTFRLYKERQGGAPVWSEVQNVQADQHGRYSALLGSTAAQGLPSELFTPGEIPWLSCQIDGQAEEPLVPLFSAIRHFPPSAHGRVTSAGAVKELTSLPLRERSFPPVPGGTGTAGYLAAWTDNTGTLGNSGLFNSVGNVGLNERNVGINTARPITILDVNSLSSGLHDPLARFGSPGPGDSNAIMVFNPASYTETFVVGSAGDFVPGTAVGDGGLLVNNGQKILFGDANRARMVLDGNGKVGTGTSAPIGLLDIVRSGSNDPALNVHASLPILANTTDGFTAVNVSNNSDVDFHAGIVSQAGGPSTRTFGVEGLSPSQHGVGVFGVATGSSNLAAINGAAGLWGDTSASPGAGVVGTAVGGQAIMGLNAGPGTTAVFMNSSATPTDLVFSTLGTRFGSGCLIDVIGNVRCTSSKSALVPVEGGSSRVALYAVEATENWFEDVGSAQLSKGSATITLERTFAETVNTGEDYHVFLTP